MSRRCGSSKPTLTPLTVWLWSQEHAKKSSRKKRRPYNKAIVTHQKPAACRRCGGEGRKGSRICRMPPVWRGGQERKALRQTNNRKGTTWRGEPSSIWRGTQALIQGRSHAKNLPRAIGKAGGWTRKRQIPGMEGGNTYSPARGGSVYTKKNEVEQIQDTKHKR